MVARSVMATPFTQVAPDAAAISYVPTSGPLDTLYSSPDGPKTNVFIRPHHFARVSENSDYQNNKLFDFYWEKSH